MAEVLSKEAVARYEKLTLEDQGKRCGMCLEKIIGLENYKTKKNKLNNKIKTICHKCKHAACAKHTLVTFQECREEKAQKNNITKYQSRFENTKTIFFRLERQIEQKTN